MLVNTNNADWLCVWRVDFCGGDILDSSRKLVVASEFDAVAKWASEYAEENNLYVNSIREGKPITAVLDRLEH